MLGSFWGFGEFYGVSSKDFNGFGGGFKVLGGVLGVRGFKRFWGV